MVFLKTSKLNSRKTTLPWVLLMTLIILHFRSAWISILRHSALRLVNFGALAQTEQSAPTRMLLRLSATILTCMLRPILLMIQKNPAGLQFPTCGLVNSRLNRLILLIRLTLSPAITNLMYITTMYWKVSKRAAASC
ncbi:hypothetical protein SDC9_129710 [bioreactor metagenome]|uniref:Uncharacterized protein n=1 Tax=bioreactor metagenome TaxID=1076179 RepID=A0A645D0K5_9ZZZZ